MQLHRLKLPDIRFDAVIVGAIVDNVTTMSLMLLLMAALSSTGISEDEVITRIKSISGLLLTLIIGLGCTGLGGYVAARMAKKQEILHGVLVGIAGIVLALIFSEKGLPLWYHIAGFVTMVPAGMGGAFIAQQRGRNISNE